jgi:uncharacterized protein (TIGR02996 family)
LTHDDAFLAGIIESPDDDAPRLIYADWLEEHGREERAEFIRVLCELARLGEDDPRRGELGARERELLARHEQTWGERRGSWWGRLRGSRSSLNLALALLPVSRKQSKSRSKSKIKSNGAWGCVRGAETIFPKAMSGRHLRRKSSFQHPAPRCYTCQQQ